MSIPQHITTATRIADLADALDVDLPGDLTARIRHAATLDRSPTTRRDTATRAATLATHLGDPDALERARKEAARDLAAADADAELWPALIAQIGATLRADVRTHAEAIAAAFAPAAQPHIDVLNTDAKTIPDGLQPEQIAGLDPDTFAAWRRVQDATGALDGMRAALAPIYRTPADEWITPDAVRALTYTQPAPDLDVRGAHATARALAGEHTAGSPMGAPTARAVLAPTATAHLGATFQWAGPTEVQARVDALTSAATPRREERKPRVSRAQRIG